MNTAAPPDDRTAAFTPATRQSPAVEQSVRLRQAMLRLALLLRFVPLSQAALTVIIGSRTYHDAWLGLATVLVSIGWSCLVARSLWHSTGDSDWIHATDVTVVAVLLVVVAGNTPPALLTTSFFWPATLLNAVMFMLGVSLPWRRGAYGLVLSAVYIWLVEHGSGHALGLANGLASVIYWVFGLVIAVYTGRLWQAIAQLDSEERGQQQALSVLQTRMEECARLHDDAMQILERAAADDLHTPALRRFALSAALGLRSVTARHAPGAAGLARGLQEVAARFAAFGFTVDVEVAAGLLGLDDPAQVSVLVASVTEALNNAFKHSGATGARVAVTGAAGGISALVCDTGTGFDMDMVSSGFGIAHSLRGRAAAAGGRVSLHSVPDGGTVVDIWVPCQPW
jgi:signal transduction histidine kinase